MRNSEKMLWIDMFFRCFGKFLRGRVNKKFFGNYYLLKPEKNRNPKKPKFHNQKLFNSKQQWTTQQLEDMAKLRITTLNSINQPQIRLMKLITAMMNLNSIIEVYETDHQFKMVFRVSKKFLNSEQLTTVRTEIDENNNPNGNQLGSGDSTGNPSISVPGAKPKKPNSSYRYSFHRPSFKTRNPVQGS